MCDPVTLTMTALAVGSAYTGYEGAKAQADMQNKMYEQNKVNSYAAMRNSYQADQTRQAQVNASAAQQIQDRQLQATQQAATANVAAGESGVSGYSVDRIMRDINGTAANDVTNIKQNRDWNLSQIQNEMYGIQSQTQSRINSVSKGVQPNKWAYVFKAGADSTTAYAMGNK